MKGLRSLAVAVGDALVVLEMTRLSGFPLPSGSTFERYVERLVAELEELTRRTRAGWKRDLLQLVQVEVADAITKARMGDEAGSHKLFVDAHLHFRQYERGEEPRVTFIAGPQGVTKA